MVEKWALCIEVSCYPNQGKEVISYVLHNIVMKNSSKGKGTYLEEQQTMKHIILH